MAKFIKKQTLKTKDIMEIIEKLKEACNISFRATVKYEYACPVEDYHEAMKVDAQVTAGKRIRLGEKRWNYPPTRNIISGADFAALLNSWHKGTLQIPAGGNRIDDLQVDVDVEDVSAERGMWWKKKGTSVVSVRLSDKFNGNQKYHGTVLCCTDPYNLYIEIDGVGEGVHVDKVLGTKEAPQWAYQQFELKHA